MSTETAVRIIPKILVRGKLQSVCRHCGCWIELKYPLEIEGRIWTDSLGFSLCNKLPAMAHEPQLVA